MKAEIISVGTELLLGDTVNTDASDVSRGLAELGIDVFRHTVVGDNPSRLAEAINEARERADIIISTGGLGPTCDDLTKQTLAKCFGLPLRLDEAEKAHLEEYFRSRSGVRMTDNNLQQAMLPEGCTVFHNQWGTAPGCAFFSGGVHVLMLPGPPRECVPMFRQCAMPYLRDLSREVIVSRNVRVFGLGESAVEAMLRPMMEELNNPTLAPYAKEGEVLLRITAKADSEARARAMTEPVLARVKAQLGDIIYGVDVPSLEAVALELLTGRGLTLAAAESCTGGLLTGRLTDIPGASRALAGGVVSYTDASKASLLGIDPALIAAEGAVSRAVAEEMARRVRQRLGADLGLGITGLAGPEGDGKSPVGTVFVALAEEGEVFVRSLSLGDDRSRVRRLAVNHALDMVRRYLTGLPPVP